MNARLDRKPKKSRRPANPDLPYGVYRRDRRKGFIVKFKQQKRNIYVGSFDDLEIAKMAAESFIRNNP